MEAHQTVAKLNVMDRVNLNGLLPAQGNAATVRVLRELRSQLEFSEEDIAKFNITAVNRPDGLQNIGTNTAGTIRAEMTFKAAATAIIVGALTKYAEKAEQDQSFDASTLHLVESFLGQDWTPAPSVPLQEAVAA